LRGIGISEGSNVRILVRLSTAIELGHTDIVSRCYGLSSLYAGEGCGTIAKFLVGITTNRGLSEEVGVACTRDSNLCGVSRSCSQYGRFLISLSSTICLENANVVFRANALPSSDSCTCKGDIAKFLVGITTDGRLACSIRVSCNSSSHLGGICVSSSEHRSNLVRLSATVELSNAYHISSGDILPSEDTSPRHGSISKVLVCITTNRGLSEEVGVACTCSSNLRDISTSCSHHGSSLVSLSSGVSLENTNSISCRYFLPSSDSCACCSEVSEFLIRVTANSRLAKGVQIPCGSSSHLGGICVGESEDRSRLVTLSAPIELGDTDRIAGSDILPSEDTCTC